MGRPAPEGVHILNPCARRRDGSGSQREPALRRRSASLRGGLHVDVVHPRKLPHIASNPSASSHQVLTETRRRIWLRTTADGPVRTLRDSAAAALSRRHRALRVPCWRGSSESVPRRQRTDTTISPALLARPFTPRTPGPVWRSWARMQLALPTAPAFGGSAAVARATVFRAFAVAAAVLGTACQPST